MALLDVRGLTVDFATPRGVVSALHDVSFSISDNEIVGLVGESGSGKSVTGLAVMGLLPEETTRVTGSATLLDTDLVSASPKKLRSMRGADIAMIFQDPLTALDPVFTVEQQLVETIRAHRKVSRLDAKKRSKELLDSVGIPRAEERLRDYPHQLSGGMRQRVMIAMALACDPKLLIADEPTTALDVTIQAQILDLVRDLARAAGTAVLFISHDLAVISELCSRVMTMYAGEIIESGPVDSILVSPRHPYTSGLLQSIPQVDGEQGHLHSIPGRVPGLDEMPTGCRFNPRCDYAIDACRENHPALVSGADDRAVRCVRADELHLVGVSMPGPSTPTAEGVRS